MAHDTHVNSKKKKTQSQNFFFNSPGNLNVIERKKMNRLVERERESWVFVNQVKRIKRRD